MVSKMNTEELSIAGDTQELCVRNDSYNSHEANDSILLSSDEEDSEEDKMSILSRTFPYTQTQCNRFTKNKENQAIWNRSNIENQTPSIMNASYPLELFQQFEEESDICLKTEDKRLRRVSQAQYDSAIKKLNTLKLQLSNNERLYKRTAKFVKDGGRQLSQQIKRLNRDIERQNTYIASIYTDINTPKYEPVDKDIKPSVSGLWKTGQTSNDAKYLTSISPLGKVKVELPSISCLCTNPSTSKAWTPLCSCIKIEQGSSPTVNGNKLNGLGHVATSVLQSKINGNTQEGIDRKVAFIKNETNTSPKSMSPCPNQGVFSALSSMLKTEDGKTLVIKSIYAEVKPEIDGKPLKTEDIKPIVMSSKEATGAQSSVVKSEEEKKPIKLEDNKLFSFGVKTEEDKKPIKLEDVKPVIGASPLMKIEKEEKPKIEDIKGEETSRDPKSDIPNWRDISNAINRIRPCYMGRQGVATFNMQKVLTLECLKKLHDSLETCPGEDVLADNPTGLKVNLMDHQRHALAWMFWRETQKPRGGILADDMGLGKTLTMISLVLACKNMNIDNNNANEESVRSHSEHSDDSSFESDLDDLDDGYPEPLWTSHGRKIYYPGGTLVICPASVIGQWEHEAKTKVSRNCLKVLVHHGSKRHRKPRFVKNYDLVITSYHVVEREQGYDGVLFSIDWKRIILDEAHTIRNHKALISEAACQLKSQKRWALSGTPIQNKELDVYGLLKFLRCPPFDDLAHWKTWIGKSAGGHQRLHTIMKTLMLRRTKIQLQGRGFLPSLPKKTIEMIEVKLDKEEMNVYQKILIFSRTLFAQFLIQRAERDPEMYDRRSFMNTIDPDGFYHKMYLKFRRVNKVPKKIKTHEILVLLLRLRQICCHPGLIDAMLEEIDREMGSDSDDDNQPEINLMAVLDKLTTSDIAEDDANFASVALCLHTEEDDDSTMQPEDRLIAKASTRVLRRSNPVFNFDRPSSKIIKIMKVLRERVLSTNDKAIIVSQWTGFLNIVKKHIEREDVETLCLTGATPVKDRQDIIMEFNNPNCHKPILLLSLTAGGVGLNLIGANHLFLIDLHWNPQLESQAQDRIYRVGQKKDVNVYKFMCSSSVEARIKEIQDKKLELANGILDGANASGGKLTINDLRTLFGV
ncbi:transcription termination factor 2-like [Haematobia irritans]|uniref:transcription termination factor 2-like n=1 Tax=Haematobia irritans TaxID=7368 RepID=UPI003F503396